MKKLIDATTLAVLLAAVATASAGTYTWTPGVSGAWDDRTKWSPNGIPAAGDVVQFGGTYSVDTTVTIGNTATVAFPQANSISGGGRLILQGKSVSERTLNISNSASDLQLTGGPLEFSSMDANISVPYSSNKRFFLTGGGSDGATRLVLSGDSTMTLNSTLLLMSGDNNTQGSRLEINDAASLVMSGAGAELQPGRGQNTWGGIVQRGGAVTCGDIVTFGNNANSFGTWEMFAGTNAISAKMRLAWGSGSKAGLYVHGGKLTLGGEPHFGSSSTGRAEVFIDGGELSFDGQTLRLVARTTDSADTPCVLTVAGNAYVHGFQLYPYGATTGYSGQSRALVNLNGNGLLSLTDKFKVIDPSSSRATLSFNGGTLQRITSSPGYEANTELLMGVDAVVYPGGGKLRAMKSTGESSAMYLNSARFRKAGGWGVSSISVTSGGAGYLLPPLVDITGGSGSNATAVAQINYETRQVTNVVVTCPGEGYAPGDVLAVSFVVPSKPSVTAATATATLAENTAGTLQIVGNSSVALGATFRYDGDFAVESGSGTPITGDVTLGGSIALQALNIRNNGKLTIAGPATATNGEMQGEGTLVIAESGSLAISGYTSLRGTVVISRASVTPLVTVGGVCSFVPAEGSSRVATLVPAEDLQSSEPIPVFAVSGNVSGALTLVASASDKWSIRTRSENGVTTIYLCPRKGFILSFR